MENSRTLFAILLALALPVFFLFLNINSIWDTNEAFYVETPRQMVRSGDYINPSFNAQPRFNKPVLSYWIVAGLYRTFGESVAVQRVGIAIGTMAIVWAAFVLGRALRSTSDPGGFAPADPPTRSLAGPHEPRSVRAGLASRATATGLLAALVVATAPRVVWFSRRIFIDVYLTVFTSLALAAFVLAISRPERRRRYLTFMYIALGLGVLTKGPVAIAMPALVCLIWLALERRLGDIRHLMLAPGLAIVAAIVLPWYVAIYAEHGWRYITTFVFDENLRRYATTAMTPSDRNVLFYLPVLLGELFPWGPLILVPLAGIAMSWRRGAGPDTTAGRVGRLLWLWIVVFVVVFSFSRTKEDLYVFPIVPAVAALVAATLTDSLASPARVQRSVGVVLGVVAGLCLAAAPAIVWLFGSSGGYYALPEATPLAVVVGLTGLVTIAAIAKRRPMASVVALAGGFIVANYLLAGWVLRGVERTKPVPPLARIIAERAAPDAKIGYFNMGLQSFVYYTGRGWVEEMGTLEHAEAFFRNPREAWALTGAGEFEALRARVPDVCVAGRRRLSIFEAKLPDIIRRIPPQEVLLVKNHCN